MSFSVPLHGRKSELALGSDLEIRIPAMFKEPFKVARVDVAGYLVGIQRIEIEDQPPWKRLPVIKAVPSSQLRGKYNLTVLFRQPVRLPELKLGGHQLLDVSGKEVREGSFVDGVTLQARDEAEAARLLKGWGITGFSSLTEAFSSLVGIEDEPVAAQQLGTERLATARRLLRITRLFAAWLIFMPAFALLIAHHDPTNVLGAAAMTALSFAFAMLFAFVYRRMRFGSSAPAAGRSHRRVIAAMAPAFAACLAGFFALKSGCACSAAAVELALLWKLLVFWAPFLWINGALAALLGQLGVKSLKVVLGALSSRELLGKRAARIL